MASSRPYNAVMHCSAHEYVAVNTLAIRIINNGVYFNTVTFLAANLSVTFAVFKAANDELTLLISQAKTDKNKLIDRDDQAILVHAYMLELILDVNKIAKHVRTIIDQSGFDESNQPQPTVKPLQPIIKKITEEKQEAGYYKALFAPEKKTIGLLTARKAKSQSKGKTRFTIKSSTAITGPYEIRLENAASNKLVFTGLVPNVKNYIIIYGVNSKGKGPESKPFPFTPQ